LFFPCAVLILTAGIALSAAAGATAEPEQKAFISPQEAVSALAAAVQEDDDAELAAILGPGSRDLISSGDSVADRNGRGRFLKAYEEKHGIEYESDVRAVLSVGIQDYPFPIPVVQRGNVWFFDTESGKEEILNRRIGRNELATVEVLHAYTDAQREYAARDRDGSGCPEFAQQFTSSKGKRDGLYWEAEEGEEESPLGPLIAKAAEAGYAGRLDTEDPEPFHGYYFKILKAQGEHANGGAFDYVVNGRMILGFSLAAYPARYGASGVMTFIVNHEGVIYEKDLGEDTAERVAAMTEYNPDETWTRCEETPGR